MNRSSSVLALSTLVGTIIGGGIFAVPFVVSRAGILLTLGYALALGIIVTLVHLMFGEIVLRTPGRHRLIGYASIYLGRWGKGIIACSTVFGIVGALLAYVIVGGEFLHLLFSPVLSLPSFPLSLAFWGVLSAFVFRGIQAIARMELALNLVLGAVIAGIAVLALPAMDLAALPLARISEGMLPFGVLLFALSGGAAIPEIADFFKNGRERGSLDNIIIIAGVVTMALTVGFGLAVAGVSGAATTEDAISGLVPVLGPAIAFLGATLGLAAVAASFLVLGNYLKNSLRYDYGMPGWWAPALAAGLPLALFLAGVRNFVGVLGIVGAVMGTIDSVAIIAVFWKAKTGGTRIPEYSLSLPRSILFFLAAVLALGGAAAVGYGI